jgi:hypothetical protein
MALAAAWTCFWLLAAFGLDLPGLLAISALLAFLWRHVRVPFVAPLVIPDVALAVRIGPIAAGRWRA